MGCKLRCDESNVDLDFFLKGEKRVGCFSAWLGASASCDFYFTTQRYAGVVRFKSPVTIVLSGKKK